MATFGGHGVRRRRGLQQASTACARCVGGGKWERDQAGRGRQVLSDAGKPGGAGAGTRRIAVQEVERARRTDLQRDSARKGQEVEPRGQRRRSRRQLHGDEEPVHRRRSSAAAERSSNDGGRSKVSVAAPAFDSKIAQPRSGGENHHYRPGRHGFLQRQQSAIQRRGTSVSYRADRGDTQERTTNPEPEEQRRHQRSRSPAEGKDADGSPE